MTRKNVAQRALAICLVVLFTLPAFAVEGDQVLYVGGTVKTIAPESVGKLNLTDDSQLIFTTGATALSIPYAKIESYHYSKEIAHHLGVVPTLAIVMVKYRQRRHFFRISFRDENNLEQSIVLEVPKTMPKVVSAVLEARASKACNGARSGSCSARQNSEYARPK